MKRWFRRKPKPLTLVMSAHPATDRLTLVYEGLHVTTVMIESITRDHNGVTVVMRDLGYFMERWQVVP